MIWVEFTSINFIIDAQYENVNILYILYIRNIISRIYRIHMSELQCMQDQTNIGFHIRANL